MKNLEFRFGAAAEGIDDPHAYKLKSADDLTMQMVENKIEEAQELLDDVDSAQLYVGAYWAFEGQEENDEYHEVFTRNSQQIDMLHPRATFRKIQEAINDFNK